MLTVSIDDVQRDLAGYLHRVQNGETLVVMEANKTLAEIKPVVQEHPQNGHLRPYGLCKGDFVVPDDFDAPLPNHVLQELLGERGI